MRPARHNPTIATLEQAEWSRDYYLVSEVGVVQAYSPAIAIFRLKHWLADRGFRPAQLLKAIIILNKLEKAIANVKEGEEVMPIKITLEG